MNHPRAANGQQGIALVLVLWLILLMTVIAASHARVIRTETRLASNQLEAARARSLAEAAAYHAVLEMLVRDEAQRWRADGGIHRLDSPGGTVEIAVRDTRGLVDINKVAATLLDKVLEGAGVAEQARAGLVDATLDWRDKDDLKHLNGAEDDDYRRAGLPWGARDGPFSSVEEFRYVLGMNDVLFNRLAPYLTVHAGQGRIDVSLAPPWLAGLLTDVQRPTSTRDIQLRQGGTFRISVRATGTGGATASLDTVVRIAPTGKQPYSILSWRAPSIVLTTAPGGGEDQSTAG
jgi:general secretion pathway protein K